MVEPWKRPRSGLSWQPSASCAWAYENESARPNAASQSLAVILVGDTFISFDMEACLARHTFAILQMVVVRTGEAFIASVFLTFDRRKFIVILFLLCVAHAFSAIPMES